jgi:hypothetical protein
VTGARLFRASPRDALVLGAALLHAALLAAGLAISASPRTGPGARVALVALLALALNWSANTVSHIQLHTPLFRGDAANRGFSLALGVLLAVPQTWWKRRHLAHHGLLDASDEPARRRARVDGVVEVAALLAGVLALAAVAPGAFVTVYVPATLAGFLLCANQGHQEHARADAGVDVHARLYNRLWFNDGFHAAHHRRPEAHWTTLPAGALAGDVVSGLPPLVRWLERAPTVANGLAAFAIDALERAACALPFARRFLVATHARAFARLLAPTDVARIREVTIIGGGLFPRTALVLARLLPDARLTLVDAVPAHLAQARAFLEEGPHAHAHAHIHIRYVSGVFDAASCAPAPDLLVVPLAFRGERARFYREPPAALVAVHDWMWRVRGCRGARVSFLLAKRINLVKP